MIGNRGAFGPLLGPDCYTENDAIDHFRNQRNNRDKVLKARQAKLNDMSSRRINYRRRLQSKIEEYQIAIDEVTNQLWHIGNERNSLIEAAINPNIRLTPFNFNQRIAPMPE